MPAQLTHGDRYHDAVADNALGATPPPGLLLTGVALSAPSSI